MHIIFLLSGELGTILAHFTALATSCYLTVQVPAGSTTAQIAVTWPPHSTWYSTQEATIPDRTRRPESSAHVLRYSAAAAAAQVLSHCHPRCSRCHWIAVHAAASLPPPPIFPGAVPDTVTEGIVKQAGGRTGRVMKLI